MSENVYSTYLYLGVMRFMRRVHFAAFFAYRCDALDTRPLPLYPAPSPVCELLQQGTIADWRTFRYLPMVRFQAIRISEVSRW